MKILIDGYNAMMAGSMALSNGALADDLRDSFIEKLVSYSALKGHITTVVFDGWRHGRPLEQTNLLRGVTVVFSKKGERADDVIKRMVSPQGMEWVVVSSDLDVRRFCQAKGAVAIHASEFIDKMGLAPYTVMKGVLSEEDELEEVQYRKLKKRHPKKNSPAKTRYIEALKKL
ncbi:MAG: NYN domain-containing protein [Nitrospinota bacterium]